MSFLPPVTLSPADLPPVAVHPAVAPGAAGGSLEFYPGLPTAAHFGSPPANSHAEISPVFGADGGG